MTETKETLVTAIPPADFSNVVEAVKTALQEGDAGVRLAGAGLDAQSLHKSVASAVEQALSISLFDALMKAWEGMKSVRALTGKDGPMDGKPRVAALLKHSLKVTHVPEIHLTFGEAVDLRKVQLPVTLTVEASGIALTVKDRRIVGVAAGYLQPSVKIEVEKVTVVEQKLRRLDFSGTLEVDWSATAPPQPPEEEAVTGDIRTAPPVPG